MFVGAARAQTVPAGKSAPSVNPAAVSAENPFAQAAREQVAAYTGRFRGQGYVAQQGEKIEQSVEVRLKPDAGRWKGTIVLMGESCNLSAETKAGRVEGLFVEAGQAAPFTATVEGDKLHFTSGKFEATLARQSLPKFDGSWGSKKVIIGFDGSGPRYTGRIKYGGLGFTFAAEEIAGDLEGVFKIGQTSYPFTLANEQRGIVFETGDFSELIHPLAARYKALPLGSRQTWTNTLGMVFRTVPGVGVLFSIWDTRVRDYTAYDEVNEKVDDAWRNVEWSGVRVSGGPDHPVTMVSWEDATAFCKWLTAQEQADGILTATQSYRLPTDAEWSAAVGLQGETGAMPKDKDMKVKGVYPWGTNWPPTGRVGNYADATAKRSFSGCTVIEGYDDGYATTSPVGSFNANRFGLYDMGGNVWQWCEDWYDNDQKYRVLRGASWDNCDPDNLLSSCRFNGTPDGRRNYIGFRCVLVGGSSR